MRLLDVIQCGLRAGKVGERFAEVAPALAAVLVNQQRGVERNVLTTSAARVQNSVLSNDASARIAEENEFAMNQAAPDLTDVGAVIHTDAYDPDS